MKDGRIFKELKTLLLGFLHHFFIASMFLVVKTKTFSRFSGARNAIYMHLR